MYKRRNTVVEEYSFTQCQNLCRIRIGDGCTIKKSAFLNCAEIFEIVIGENVTIEDNAFKGTVYERIKVKFKDRIPAENEPIRIGLTNKPKCKVY